MLKQIIIYKWCLVKYNKSRLKCLKLSAQCICKLDFGKVLWKRLYDNVKLTYSQRTMCWPPSPPLAVMQTAKNSNLLHIYIVRAPLFIIFVLKLLFVFILKVLPPSISYINSNSKVSFSNYKLGSNRPLIPDQWESRKLRADSQWEARIWPDRKDVICLRRWWIGWTLPHY